MNMLVVLLAVCLSTFTVDADDKCDYCKALAFALRFSAKMKSIPPEKIMGWRCERYKASHAGEDSENVGECEEVMKELMETTDAIKHAQNLEDSPDYNDPEKICFKDKGYCKR
ncbi:hypothetical protein ANCCAN_03704 [Ancylostoma caninum]|uniref:Saposin B-type domain-containing protein n=1 Tax=Ancylostoma caninum TaxID=29170 RepID=A0A368H394_ANCCA|nr:hypothetical protein ANCCAN_03704 [Ancylostoma caninum]